jgi:hypothetical protein
MAWVVGPVAEFALKIRDIRPPRIRTEPNAASLPFGQLSGLISLGKHPFGKVEPFLSLGEFVPQDVHLLLQRIETPRELAAAFGPTAHGPIARDLNQSMHGDGYDGDRESEKGDQEGKVHGERPFLLVPAGHHEWVVQQ